MIENYLRLWLRIFVAAAMLSGVISSAYAKPIALDALLQSAIPTGLAALPGNAKVTLSWVGSAGATPYRVY